MGECPCLCSSLMRSPPRTTGVVVLAPPEDFPDVRGLGEEGGEVPDDPPAESYMPTSTVAAPRLRGDAVCSPAEC